jgi:hypothetical protein
VAVLVGLMVVLSGCRVVERVSENAYLSAVADGAAAELGERGHPVAGRLACALPPAESGTTLRVRCAGRTTAGLAISLSGTVERADTARPDERYVVTVDGREVLRAGCLGAACQDGRGTFRPVPNPT